MNTTAFSAIQIRYVETVSPGKDRPIYRVFAPVAWSDEQIKAAFVTAARRLVGYLFPANRPPAQASTFDVLITGDGKGHPLLSDEAHYLHLAVNLATQRAASSASGRSRTPADIPAGDGLFCPKKCLQDNAIWPVLREKSRPGRT